MAEFFKINSKSIHSPTELSVSIETLDKSERTMDGTMVVDIIGQKRKVDVSWEYLSKEDTALLSNEIKSGGFVSITFNDSNTGELTSMTAKAESFTHKPHFDWAKNKLMWKGVSVSFVEK